MIASDRLSASASPPPPPLRLLERPQRAPRLAAPPPAGWAARVERWALRLLAAR